MKVIETFVTSVPRNEIHPDAEFFTQDRDDGSLSQFSEKPSTKGYYWYGNRYEGSLGRNSVSDDADRTIITREELMKAYDLVERGYELWFGGDIPVPHSTGVSVVLSDGSTQSQLAGELWWGNREPNPIIAYRLSETEDKSPSLYPLSEEKVKAIQANIKHINNTDWIYSSDNVLINKNTGGYITVRDHLLLITKDEWNTYLKTIKIEVGDTVSFIHSNVFYEVLYVGKEKAFIKDSDEQSIPSLWKNCLK